MQRLCFGLVAILLCTACTQVPEWTLFYYPQQQQLPQTVHHYEAISGYYETLQQCEAKGHGMQLLADEPAVFQCAHRCRLDDANVVTCDQWHTFTPEP
ncbi:hypothetical protein [Shewanella dokdonensis]|uniref:Lipoprotein n=1 Tax=Shewanella dokdonensis TaxID=712036 RepID=A0ABX8DAR8_9GAMM|nr:hypothetical protein [Shewanella dokdonensis]MCL1075218.1 hypothetical protein [Shewanella dokdonensis]QVK21949.1 hypothetical protein KHX94_10570 [Shewanella dokdonensis]